MLHIYNSLTRKKAPFEPIQEGKVSLYVCGMTVYDYCHIGHASALVAFDMVTRYLRASGYEVTYVRNVTDIDDKIIARANENGETISELTERMIAAMHEDVAYLGVLPPDIEPRATAHIDDIIDMIRALEKKGVTYHASNGDVYYRVRQFPDYGKLSGKVLDDMQVGARVAEDKEKEDPLDFVLWKASKPDEPAWDSPWGKGRPGWHIECSAMSTCCLGNHFDIHAGGIDLQFPHHENEIAQSEAATGEPFVNIWMHNGHVRVDNEKMSKSLDNFFTIREILDQDPVRERIGEVLRFMMLGSHYRSPLNYSTQVIDNARKGLERLYKLAARLNSDGVWQESNPHWQQFVAAMDDDFNTPEALAVLFDLAREINRTLDAGEASESTPGYLEEMLGSFQNINKTLGILNVNTDVFLGLNQGAGDEEVVTGYTASQIDNALADRAAAKARKDYASADQIRDTLSALGIVVEDKPDGAFSWRVE